jgi:hypothetical protein
MKRPLLRIGWRSARSQDSLNPGGGAYPGNFDKIAARDSSFYGHWLGHSAPPFWCDVGFDVLTEKTYFEHENRQTLSKREYECQRSIVALYKATAHAIQNSN